MLIRAHKYYPLGVLSVGLIAAGCVTDITGDEAEDSVSETEAAVQAANGISVNGISMNGISVNGTSLTGASLVSVSTAGITLGGVAMNSVSVSAFQLAGIKQSNGAHLSGAGMVGSLMKGTLTSGGTLDLRIDASATLTAPNADIRTYAISYNTTSGWKPLCAGTNEALLFPGTWNLTTVRHQANSNAFAAGCRAATFAKCAELGYKTDGQLDNYHQTCTRAIRADYCGDGVSHTVDGTTINIYDKANIQVDTQAWSIESNWTIDGAICIGKTRIATALTDPGVPACMTSRAQIVCNTSSWPNGVLFRTEVNR